MDYVTVIRNWIIGITIVVLVVFFAVYFGIIWYKKNHKQTRMKEKAMDTSKIKRSPSEMLFMDVVDIDDDMIIMDNGTRFVAAITTYGSDFYDENYTGQCRIAEGFASFVNTITKPICYRVSTTTADNEKLQHRYDEILESRLRERDDLKEELSNIRRLLKDSKNENESALYKEKLEELENKIEIMEDRIFRVQHMIQYIHAYSGEFAPPLGEELWIVEWEYFANNFSADLSDAEIYKRAQNELQSLCDTKIRALANAGVRARRTRTWELIDCCRRHSAPITSSKYRIHDVLNSSYFEDIHQSNTCEVLRDMAIEEQGMSLMQELDAILDVGEGDK